MPVIENTELIFLAMGAAICFLLLLLVFSLFRNNRILRKNLQAIESQNRGLAESLQSLVQRTESFGEEYRQLQTDLALKGLYDGSSDAYLQAINAAKSGTSAIEIADNFGMIKSEAELIVSIHGVR